MFKNKEYFKSHLTSLPLFLLPKQLKLAKNIMITKVQYITSYWIKFLKYKQDKRAM